MNNNRPKRSLLLIEIGILLLFFAFSAAICANIFAAAGNKSKEANDISRSVIMCQNAAEAFKSADGDINRTAEICGASEYDETSFSVYYDADAVICDESSAVYILNLTAAEIDPQGMIKAAIKVTKDAQSVYEINVGVLKAYEQQ